MSPTMAMFFPCQVVAQALTQAERVQQGLGGVFVRSIAGIDNGHVDFGCQELMGSGMGVTHHHHVHLHGQDVVDGVNEGLPFFHG